MSITGNTVSRIALLAGLVAAAMTMSGADNARAAGTCTEDWKPVCATSNGFQRVYSNACWAKMNKAKIVNTGMCKWK